MFPQIQATSAVKVSLDFGLSVLESLAVGRYNGRLTFPTWQGRFRLGKGHHETTVAWHSWLPPQ